MSARERAATLRQRLTADIMMTLNTNGVAPDENAPALVETLVDDAMHQVEILLVEIDGLNERLALRDHLDAQ